MVWEGYSKISVRLRSGMDGLNCDGSLTKSLTYLEDGGFTMILMESKLRKNTELWMFFRVGLVWTSQEAQLGKGSDISGM